MDRGALRVIVHGVTKEYTHVHAYEFGNIQYNPEHKQK